MLDCLRFWRYYRYPAHHWGRSISEILKRTSIEGATIIDAPCGDGIITYWVIKSGVGRKYELYDISEKPVSIAQRMLGWRRSRDLSLHIEEKNVLDIPVEGATNDVWLLINSLYLLSDIDQLLSRMRGRVKTIVAVFPRTSSRNYERWLAGSPDLNINQMGQAETVEFFARQGYGLQEQQEFCFVPLMHLRSKYVRLAAMFLVNPIEKLFPRREACYWLGVFCRSEDA